MYPQGIGMGSSGMTQIAVSTMVLLKALAILPAGTYVTPGSQFDKRAGNSETKIDQIRNRLTSPALNIDGYRTEKGASFVREKKINFGVSYGEAIAQRYSVEEAASAHKEVNSMVIVDAKRQEISVELVGLEKIEAQAK